MFKDETFVCLPACLHKSTRLVSRHSKVDHCPTADGYIKPKWSKNSTGLQAGCLSLSGSDIFLFPYWKKKREKKLWGLSALLPFRRNLNSKSISMNKAIHVGNQRAKSRGWVETRLMDILFFNNGTRVPPPASKDSVHSVIGGYIVLYQRRIVIASWVLLPLQSWTHKRGGNGYVGGALKEVSSLRDTHMSDSEWRWPYG